MATLGHIGTVPEDKKTWSHHCEGKTRKSTQPDEGIVLAEALIVQLQVQDKHSPRAMNKIQYPLLL